MKKYIKIIFALFFISVNAQIKQGVIKYKKQKISKTFIKEKNKKFGDKKLKRFSIIEDKIIVAEKKVIFSLHFNNQESLFKAKKILNSDRNRFLKMALGPYGKAVFYNSNNQTLYNLNAFGQEFLISKQKYKWAITKERKKIGNYLCYKATLIEKMTTSRGEKKLLVTAWFTPQINVPFGPLGYSGLPGLILELEARNYRYYATKINLNPKEKIQITKPTKGKKITQEEFYKIAAGTMKDLRKRKGF